MKQDCKVFIGGLSWETTDQKLRAYFENYGAVQEAFVSYDRNTGRPRGFGFVVFETPEVADKVVATKHTIDRREVEAKKAVPKDDQQTGRKQNGSSGQKTKKIFVGGLAPSVDENALREYFQQYGQVEDSVVMYDHDNKRPRGFGFITFAQQESVEKVFEKGVMQTLHDKQIEIKAAVPRDQMPPSKRSTAFVPAARGQMPGSKNSPYSPPPVAPGQLYYPRPPFVAAGPRPALGSGSPPGGVARHALQRDVGSVLPNLGAAVVGALGAQVAGSVPPAASQAFAGVGPYGGGAGNLSFPTGYSAPGSLMVPPSNTASFPQFGLQQQMNGLHSMQHMANSLPNNFGSLTTPNPAVKGFGPVQPYGVPNSFGSYPAGAAQEPPFETHESRQPQDAVNMKVTAAMAAVTSGFSAFDAGFGASPAPGWST